MTQRDHVLAILRAGGTRGATTTDFLGARLPRFSARILELRNLGYNIHRARLNSSDYRYTLLSTPEGLAHTPRLPVDTPPPVEVGADQGALFNEDPDDLPRWMNMDDLPYRGGGVMGRRRDTGCPTCGSRSCAGCYA